MNLDVASHKTAKQTRCYISMKNHRMKCDWNDATITFLHSV